VEITSACYRPAKTSTACYSQQREGKEGLLKKLIFCGYPEAAKWAILARKTRQEKKKPTIKLIED